MVYFLLIPLKNGRYLLSYFSVPGANASWMKGNLEFSTQQEINKNSELRELLDEKQSPYYWSCKEDSSCMDEIKKIIFYQPSSVGPIFLKLEDKTLFECLNEEIRKKTITTEEVSWDQLRQPQSTSNIDEAKSTAEKKQEEKKDEGSSSSGFQENAENMTKKISGGDLQQLISSDSGGSNQTIRKKEEKHEEGSSSSIQPQGEIERDLRNLQAFYELIRPRKDPHRQNIYLLSKSPENLEFYKNSYIFFKKTNPRFFYITPNGEMRRVRLDVNKFENLKKNQALHNLDESQPLHLSLDEENKDLLESFWSLITFDMDHTHLDSAVIKAMKIHPKIGVHSGNEYKPDEFKPSHIDSFKQVEERLALGDRVLYNRECSAKAYQHDDHEEKFVLTAGLLYYKSQENYSQNQIKYSFSHPLSRLKGQYPIYVVAAPEVSVKNYEVENPESDKPEKKDESLEKRREFLKAIINHVGNNGKGKVIFLVHGVKDGRNISWENTQTYTSLGWENSQLLAPGSNIDVYTLSKSKTEAEKDIEITYLNTTNRANERHWVSIQITEEDLWHLRDLATKVRDGYPIIIHCHAGYDRAPRSALAIDLFLQFNEIMHDTDADTAVERIIERYLSLRRSRAPGALKTIKQCQEALSLAYAFKAIDVYEKSLQHLRQSTNENDFFQELEKCSSIVEKVAYVEKWLDEHEITDEDNKKQFFLFERVLRECRLAVSLCLWEVNPQRYLQFFESSQDEREELKAITVEKQSYLETILLEDHFVLLRRHPDKEVTMRPALLASGIIWDKDEEILKTKKTRVTPFSNTKNTEEHGEKRSEEGNRSKGKEVDDEDGVKPESVPGPEEDSQRKNKAVEGEEASKIRPKPIGIRKWQSSKEIGFTLSDRDKEPFFAVLGQHQAKAKAIDEFIDNTKTIFEERLKSSIDKQYLNLENDLVHYIYNRIQRRKTKTLSMLFGNPEWSATHIFSPELFHIKNEQEKKSKYREIVNYSLCVYSDENKFFRDRNFKNMPSQCAVLLTDNDPTEGLKEPNVEDEAYVIYRYKNNETNKLMDKFFYVSKTQNKCVQLGLKPAYDWPNFCAELEVLKLKQNIPRILSNSELEKITEMTGHATYLRNELNELHEEDLLTYKKIIDAFYLMRELHHQRNQLVDDALCEILNENPDGPVDMSENELNQKAANLEIKARESMLNIIKQHHGYNQDLENKKILHRLFPCFSRFSHSTYSSILEDSKKELKETSTPSSKVVVST